MLPLFNGAPYYVFAHALPRMSTRLQGHMKEFLSVISTPYMYDAQFQSMYADDIAIKRALALFRSYVITVNLCQFLQVPRRVSAQKMEEDFWWSVPALSQDEVFYDVFEDEPMSFFVTATCTSPATTKKM